MFAGLLQYIHFMVLGYLLCFLQECKDGFSPTHFRIIVPRTSATCFLLNRYHCTYNVFRNAGYSFQLLIYLTCSIIIINRNHEPDILVTLTKGAREDSQSAFSSHCWTAPLGLVFLNSILDNSSFSYMHWVWWSWGENTFIDGKLL